MAAPNFHRHLTFKRMYRDDSGMPEWPRGSTRATSYRFDNRESMIKLVSRMVHNPGEFKPYFDDITPPLMVRVMTGDPGDPGVLPGNFRDSLQFSRMLHPQNPGDFDSLAVETYRGYPGAIKFDAPHSPYVNLSLMFAVHNDDDRYEFAKWIEAHEFLGLINGQTAVYFTSHLLPPAVSVEDNPALAPANWSAFRTAPERIPDRSHNPFAPGGRVPRPVSPTVTVVSAGQSEDGDADNVNDNRSGSDPSDDEGSEVPQPLPDSDDDVVPEADDDSDDDAVPIPRAEDILPHRGPEYFPQQALRRISDELFDVRQEMPEGVYMRLSNSLKRRIGE